MKDQLWVSEKGAGPDAALFKAVEVLESRPWVKPWEGGLWTSTLDNAAGSGWLQWCRDERGFGLIDEQSTYWRLPVLKTARLYTIATLQDLETLLEQHPHHGTTRPAFRDRYPHWENALRDDYDGIHLTDEGQWATRMTTPGLYGWDCESTLWGKWSFGEPEQLAELPKTEPSAAL